MIVNLTFSLLISALLISLAGSELTCTHGLLFVSDAASSDIHVIDTSSGLASLDTLKHTITVGEAGNGINLRASGSLGEVAAIYVGQPDLKYEDGHVAFIDAGSSAEDHGDHADVVYTTPSLIENSAFDCARAIHFVPHDKKIAIFCDGNYGDSMEDQVNSTVWVLDETAFGHDESAIVFRTTLQGSHHGVAIPVDDNHILYSLALEDRITRTEAGSVRGASLPATFIVTDYDGAVLKNLTNTSSPDTSCSGFHGESGKDNKFALACDDSHGGILLVDYDPEASTYSSRALSYPNGYEDHRTGSLQGPLKGDFTIGNFGGETTHYLMAFTHDETTLTADHLYEIGATRQCAFAYEKSTLELVLVLMPNGMLQVLELHQGEWEKVAEKEIISGLSDCDDVLFEAGFGHAFVVQKSAKTIHGIDLQHVMEGELEVQTVTLSFEPFDIEISGVPEGTGCKEIEVDHDGHDHGDDHDDHDHGDDHDDHDHGDDHGDGDGEPNSAAASSALSIFNLLPILALIAL